jgi:ribonuclease HI
MSIIKQYVVNFDGSCEPVNPNGTMGMGVSIQCNGKVVHTISEKEPLGENYSRTTNNLAEYLALKLAMEWCIQEEIKNVHIIGDSKLVIKQMNGDWKIKDGEYKPIAIECHKLKKHFTTIFFTHVLRDKNSVADKLSK